MSTPHKPRNGALKAARRAGGLGALRVRVRPGERAKRLHTRARRRQSERREAQKQTASPEGLAAHHHNHQAKGSNRRLPAGRKTTHNDQSE